MTQDEIFKRLALANKFITETEFKVLDKSLAELIRKGETISLMGLALKKQKLSETHARMLERPIKYNTLRYEDRQCCKYLIKEGVITKNQMDMFMEKQSGIYREKRTIISTLELMRQKGLLTLQQVSSTRNSVKNAENRRAVTDSSLDLVAITEKTEKKGPPPEMSKGAFTVKYLPQTIDVNNRPVYMTLLDVSGSVDSYSAPTLDKMCREVFDLAGDRGRYIIMDVTNVSYMSSAGIGIVIGWRKEAQERGGDIHFVGMQKDVIGVFKLIGMENTLFICKNASEAMWSFMKNK